MSLPSREELKEYLRVETTVDDLLIDRLLVQAKAAVEAYIRQPIEARAVTVDVETGYSTRLAFPLAPVQVGSVTVEDGDGVTVDPSTYTVHEGRGWISAVSPAYFGAWNGPLSYRITATAGLSLRDDYTAAVEPVMSAAIIDWAADLYQRRNPAASYESGGGGVAVNYNETASKTMPSRVRVTLDPWRRMLV